MPLVICACSNRKFAPTAIRAGDLPEGDIAEVANRWFEGLASAERHTAGRLYAGRSVREAQRAAKILDGELIFASAGLGWIPAVREVPSYGMTVVPSDDNVLSRIRGGVSPADWWSWMTHHSPFSIPITELAKRTGGLILVALPHSYLEMVRDDLVALGHACGERLRIIGRAGDLESAELAPWVIGYDERLNGAGPGWAGTQSDFAPRAARHFAELILPGRENEAIEDQRRAVAAALAQWTIAERPVRRKASDAELEVLIREQLSPDAKRTKPILRVLRDDFGIACEQGRCKRLVDAVRAQMAGALA